MYYPTVLRVSMISLSCVAATVSAAGAQPRCVPDRAVVTVTFQGEAFGDAFRAGVLENLRAALDEHGFSVCEPGELPATRTPEATIELTTSELPHVAVTIEVDDAVTQKRVARDVDLAAFPTDSRAFALAVTTDELLRASFLELALEDAPEPVVDVPAEVTAVVERSVARARAPGQSLGARFAFEAYAGGERHAGGDLVATLAPAPWLYVDLALGGRAGFTRASDHGSVRSRALIGEARLRARLLRAGALSLDATLGGRALHVGFEGRPNASADGRTATDVAIVTGAGIVGRVDAGILSVRLGVGAGIPLRSVGALDGDEQATAVGGLALQTEAGLAIEL